MGMDAINNDLLVKPQLGCLDDSEMEAVAPAPTKEPKGKSSAVTDPIGALNLSPEQYNENVMQPIFNQYYCNNPEVEERLNDNITDNDTYEVIPGLNVEYRKVGDEIFASYSETVEKPALQNNNSNGIFESQDDYKTFMKLSENLLNPMIKNKDYIEQQMQSMLVDALGGLVKDNGLPTYPDLADRIKIAEGMIEDMKAEDCYQHRTVYYDRKEYKTAKTQLKNDQKEARKWFEDKEAELHKLADSDEGKVVETHKYRVVNGTYILDDENGTYTITASKYAHAVKQYYASDEYKQHMDIMKKNVEYLNDSDICDFIKNHKYLFYTDGKFDSDKYKEFAHFLTGEDPNLSLADRSNPENLFAMWADKKAWEAKDRLAKEKAGEYTYENDEDRKNDIYLAGKAERKGWFYDNDVWNGPNRANLGYLQRKIVKAAGLRADYDWRPLITVAGFALTIGLTQLTDQLLRTTKIANATTDVTITLNGTTSSGGAITQEMLDNALQEVTDPVTGATTYILTSDALADFNISSIGMDVIADAYAKVGITGCQQYKWANFTLGTLNAIPKYDGSANVPQFGISAEDDKTITFTGDVKITPCCDTKKPDPVQPKQPTTKECEDDCVCDETKKFTIPMPQTYERDGKCYRKRIEFWEIMNCFRKPNGKKMTWDELTVFIHAYREENFADLKNPQTGYFKPGVEHEICTKFKIGDTVYELDTAALDYLLAHPIERECKDETNATKTHGVKKKDEPCIKK